MLNRSPLEASAPTAILAVLLVLGLAAMRVAAAPVINPVGTVQVPAGKTLVLPLTAQSPEGLPLTYTVTSGNPGQIDVTLHANNPWLKLGVAGFGEMTLQLLHDRAPNTVDIIRGLVQSGFYNGLKFHRVVSGFVIQGGDPKGDGTGGPQFLFDDEFDPRVIFSGSGQLAMANTGKDSNGSQFFITVAPHRELDFNYTIFGQLVRGFNVLTNISLVPTNNSSKPLSPVIITNAMIFTNLSDAVITLSAASGGAANVTITVRVNDSAGGSATNTFTAQRVADAIDDPPILGPVTNVISPGDAQVQITLSSTDLENNPVLYGWAYLNGPAGVGVGAVSNLVSINPPAGYTGPMTFVFGVREQGAAARGSTADPNDYQVMTIAVGDTPTTVFGTNFLAVNGVTFSNQVVATFTNVNASRTADKYTSNIDWGDGIVTSNAVIRARTNGPGFEVVGTHSYTNGGGQRLGVDVTTVRGSVAFGTGTVTVPPTLRIARAAASQTASWPAWAFDYQLQSNPNLGTTNWTTVTNLPAVVGFENVVTNGNSASNFFFRLRR